jgi:uncharacterized protein YbaR (Trm112 family)
MSSVIKPELLEILACPCDKHSDVSVSSDDAKIVCSSCATTFPIKDGIPVMLLDEATPGPRGIGG